MRKHLAAWMSGRLSLLAFPASQRNVKQETKDQKHSRFSVLPLILPEGIERERLPLPAVMNY